MSFMNKVKNFFYEDVEEEVEEVKHEEPKKKFNPFKKEPKKEEPEVNFVEETPKEVKQQANNDLSERELFKAERTFNFPMDLGDEIFDNEEESVKEETKVQEPVYTRSEPVKEPYTRSMYHNISREEPKREEKKKFKPTPVISPVYGILDKNYTVDDVVDVDKTKEFSFDKKIVDFDSVRNKAYKELDEELEKTMNNDIFYNLDDEDIKEEPEEDLHSEEPSVIITYEDLEETPEVEAKEVEFKEEIPEEEPVLEKTVEITDEPVEVPTVVVEEEDEDISPDVQIEIPKKRRSRSTAKKEEPEEEVKKEKEDLFNLIDNMYSEDEEEEDE